MQTKPREVSIYPFKNGEKDDYFITISKRARKNLQGQMIYPVEIDIEGKKISLYLIDDFTFLKRHETYKNFIRKQQLVAESKAKKELVESEKEGVE